MENLFKICAVLGSFLLTAGIANAQSLMAPSCSQSDISSTIATLGSGGGTVTFPSGACSGSSGTWTSQFSLTVTAPITLQGNTVCTGTGDPGGGTSGVISCTDVTQITCSLSSCLNVTGTSTTNYFRMTGFTLNSSAANSEGIWNITGTHGQQSFRFDHNHIVASGSDSYEFAGYSTYGLVDHNYFQDTVSSGTGTSNKFVGDGASFGYLNWVDPTNIGSNQAYYVEQNYFTSIRGTTEGTSDEYTGCKIVKRFNTVVGNVDGGWHGTDSGNLRGCVLGEIYGNAFISNTTMSSTFFGQSRSGIAMLWSNTFTGTNSSPFGGFGLEYYRLSQPTDAGFWGAPVGAGQNWSPVVQNNGVLAGDSTQIYDTIMTIQGALSWAGTTNYSSLAVVIPSSYTALAQRDGDSHHYQNESVSSCTSGGTHPIFGQSENITSISGSVIHVSSAANLASGYRVELVTSGIVTQITSISNISGTAITLNNTVTGSPTIAVFVFPGSITIDGSCNWVDIAGVNSPDWASGVSYSTIGVTSFSAQILPLTNNPGNYYYAVFENQLPCTTGGSYPSSWNQTPASTTTDGGGCQWRNLGGQANVAGFCAVNPDTIAGSNSTCNALSSGDTASRYFDTNGGIYPYRDMPGRGHNQALFPNYEWGNSGSQSPSQYFNSSTPSAIVQNRDYFLHNTSITGSVGVSVGPLSSIPGSCTNGVGYFATDQGSWNTSGNGFGNGLLYQCQSGSWQPYYSPYTYPYPVSAAYESFTPESVTFPGFTVVGSTSQNQLVTFTYTGSGTLSLTTLKASANFSWNKTGITGPCTPGTTMLTQNTSCAFNVVFVPGQTLGTVAGNVTAKFTGDPNNTSLELPLQGTSTEVKLSPTALAFGTVSSGTKNLSVTATNKGTTPLQITGHNITGSTQFSVLAYSAGPPVISSCLNGTVILDQNVSCTFTVQFAHMDDSNTLNGTLMISDNDPSSPQMVDMTATD